MAKFYRIENPFTDDEIKQLYEVADLYSAKLEIEVN